MPYTIKTAPNGGKILQVNGRDCICPFQPVQFVPVETEEVDLGTGSKKVKTARVTEICGDKCPLFALHTMEVSVTLHCGIGRDILLKSDKTAQA